MSEDKLKWDIEHLQKESKEQNKKIAEHSKEIRDLRSFKDSTVEKLVMILNTIEEMKENDRWLKRVFTSSLVTAIIGAVGSLIVWLIQN